MIRISPIRLVGADNEQIGVVSTDEAIRMAQEAGLDLVEVVPDSRPPVCKIMDYGKFKYEQSKKETETRAKSKQAELKEIRLGRSVKIDPHDVQIRIDQARRFLMDGHKVQFIQRFRGREITHKHLGLENLDHAREQLADISKVELEPRLIGRQANMMLAPDKVKIQALKRKLEKEKADAEAASETPAETAERRAREKEDQDDKARKPSGDQRAKNPVDDEINALLGD